MLCLSISHSCNNYCDHTLEEIDCGPPNAGNELIIKYFNGTKLDAFVTFHCEQSNISMMTVCRNSGEWIPNPASFECVDGTLGNYEYFY